MELCPGRKDLVEWTEWMEWEGSGFNGGRTFSISVDTAYWNSIDVAEPNGYSRDADPLGLGMLISICSLA